MDSFAHRFKRLDLYRDVPKDLTEQTFTGAIVSVVCALAIVYLFLSEFISFLSTETIHEMYIDQPRYDDQHYQLKDAMLTINMNITVPHMPCAITSVDVQDIMGSHLVDVGGKLHKSRTDSEGNLKRDGSGFILSGDLPPSNPHDQIGEGCNIHGTMIVKMVPGNFHISAHAHAELIHIYFPNQAMNCTHFIHNLFFGESLDLVDIDRAAVAPLKNTKRIAMIEQGVVPMPSHPADMNNEITKSYEYYIKIVPTVYQKLSSPPINSFQYVANSNEIAGRFRLPAIYFRYETSPITVKFSQKRKSFAHFLVQVCAIIGGVFTVLGLLNAVILDSVKKFKSNIGKLG